MKFLVQFAMQLVLLVLMLRQTQAALSDDLGSEQFARENVEADSLGGLDTLGIASEDADAPEHLDLQGQDKPKALTSAELALVQSKSSHKQEVRKKQAPAGNLRSKVAIDRMSQDANELGDDESQNTVYDTVVAAAPVAEPVPNSESQANADDSNDAAEAAKPALPAEAAKPAVPVEAAKPPLPAHPASDDADAETVFAGAMAYVRTKLAVAEHKGLLLHQQLAQSERSNKKLKQRFEQLKVEYQKGVGVHKEDLEATSKKLAQEETEVTKEKKRADAAMGHLKNATRAAQIGEKTMKFLGVRLKYAKSQVAALLLNLANYSTRNKDLRREFDAVNSTEVKEAQELAESRMVEDTQAKELAEVKAKLQKLQTAKKNEDVKVKTLDRQTDMLSLRQGSAKKRELIFKKENSLLKSQLASEIQREEQLREMWTKESEAFTWQLRAERANATDSLADLDKARAEFKDLRNRVQDLRERAGEGEHSRKSAEDMANRAESALLEARAENKQLKGSVPWLEAEVDRQRLSVKAATKQSEQAVKERDNVKNILNEAQKNIAQLQGQYADALQALVVAQAGGSQQASLGDSLLGPAPTTSSVVQAQTAPRDASSLLELERDSKALNNVKDITQVVQPRSRVDLEKENGGLSNLLRGLRDVR